MLRLEEVVNLAQVVMSGNLVADPDCQQLADGCARTMMRLAANSRQLDPATGRWRDGDATFLTVVAYRFLAEQAAQLRKGQRLLVIGQLRQHDYARDGQRSLGYEVVAQDLGLGLSARSGVGAAATVSARAPRS
jgi:single-strand DNA-binding protein